MALSGTRSQPHLVSAKVPAAGRPAGLLDPIPERAPSMQASEPRLSPSHEQRKINWLTTGFMVFFHVGAIASLFFFSWTNLVILVLLHYLAVNMGIGVAYHRLLTHRGYWTPKWLEYVMTTCATLALEGGPIFWVATHRLHHQHSDRAGDPHSPREGTWWAHVGWILTGNTLHSETTLLSKYAPDLMRDRFHLWISRYHWIPLTTLGIGLLLVGAWIGGWRMGVGMILWGALLRTTLGLHATWLVNSATHMFGKRRFETKDDSRNSWWVAILTGGEGWHNNHHAHPVSARHGLAWYEFDINYYTIWLFSKIGLVKRVQVATLERKVQPS
jgi:fatty-acid desaturase